MKEKGKIIAIFIAYNAATTLEKFYRTFPRYLVDEVILVDDASKDDTYAISEKLGIPSYRNARNLGYGGNMKQALKIALDKGADIIVDIHPDGEYDPSAMPAAIAEIERGAQFVLGNRFPYFKKPLENGMYVWKLIPIAVLNKLAALVLRVQISDFHQGFRVYTRELLEKVNFEKNSNNYLFSFEIIAQAAYHKIPITQVTIETNYSGKKRGASLKNSILYSLGTIKVMALFLLAKGIYTPMLFQKTHPPLISYEEKPFR